MSFRYLRKYGTQLSIVFLSISMSSIALGAAKPKPIISEPNPTKWEEIYSWKSLGSRWEAGFDQSGQILAIYDLSLDEVKSRVFLGVLDPSLEGIDDLISIFQEKQKNLNRLSAFDHSHSDPSREIQKAIDGLKDFKSRQLQTISTMDKRGILPPAWWKQIPWKSSVRTLGNKAPKHFSLSEIDFQSVAQDPQEFKKQINEIHPNLLEQLQFIESKPGSYAIYWQPTRSQNQTLNNNRPQKVIDFRCTECGFINTMLRSATTQALKSAVSQIPIPVLSGLLGTAVSEYLYFHSESTRIHEEMALEMIEEAEETPGSPFSALTSIEREKAAQYILLSQVGLLQSLKLIGSPTLSFWAQEKWVELKLEATELSQLSQKELMTRGEKFELINARFAFAPGNNHLKRTYILSHPKQWQSIFPYEPIDLGNSTSIQEERIHIETMRALTHFLTTYIPIPGVGTLINAAYDWAIVSPMHISQYWEARLASHLENRLLKHESWANELQILENQRVNPFELNSSQSLEKVRVGRDSLHSTPTSGLQ